MVPTEPKDDLVNITLSVGQSKIGAGAIDRAGNEVCQLEEIVTPRESSARLAAIVQQIVTVTHKVDLDLDLADRAVDGLDLVDVDKAARRCVCFGFARRSHSWFVMIGQRGSLG